MSKRYCTIPSLFNLRNWFEKNFGDLCEQHDLDYVIRAGSRVEADKKFKEKFGELKGEEHKRIPKEFAEEYKEQPLLIKKSFYVNHQFPADTILKDNLIDICMEHFMAVQDFGEFLYESYSW